MLMLSFTLGLSVSPAYSQATKDLPPAAEFELRAGDTKYDVAEGKTFFIVTPKGERVELLLRRKEVLQFADHGASFNYDSAMKVSVAKELGVVVITLDSTSSPTAIIQIHSAAVSPEELRTALLQSLREEFKSRGAEFLEGSGKNVRRQFRGAEREGQYLEFLLSGERTRLEVYAFQKGNTVITLTLMHLTSDAELAKRYFTVITNSLH
jgi:hypothetical protein